MRNPEALPLHLAKKGSLLRVVQVPDGTSKAQLIRLGILQGEMVRCLEKLPGGTVVLEKNRQEIAIGVSLARTILVVTISPDQS
ncbi:MAG: FeoA family protein [Bacteroidota bacterium]